MAYGTPMTSAPIGQDISGVVQDIQAAGTFVGRDGKNVPKYLLTVNGEKLSGIGAVPPIAKGDQVMVRVKINGNFKNVSDIIKNGQSVLPRRFGGGFGGNSMSPQLVKSNILLAATLIATQNSAVAKQPVTMDDIKSVMAELEKVVG